MVQQTSGKLIADSNDRFAIVVSRFNDLVTGKLLSGAIDTLTRHGVAEDSISVFWVSGAFELPVVAEKLAAKGDVSAVLALGAVIQGDTDHHEYINHAVAQGLMNVSQKFSIPTLFGVLTCRTMEQALDRAGGKAGNKGAEAALAAIETLDVLRQIS
ncbi:6,7-dimethyl-8-ribityllumazine synthase [Thalassoglobus sp. JC818]|uniref:6,7-dimethyl-8-ribityllumazine synthase n=1 Tax=Thalassoglobus sp. JC818 TaxID=3232136 RepID=UPI003459E791